MGILSKLMDRKEAMEEKVRAKEEEYISLIRVYYQSVMAANLGITNIRMLPDLAMFKRLLKVPTLNGRLGLGEKSASRKILMQDYGLSDWFFDEIDASIKKQCKRQTDIQGFFITFQGFSNDLLMVVGSDMQWKLRLPAFFKKMMRSMIEKSVHDVFTKNSWKAVDVRQASWNVRSYNEKLNYSEKWIVEFIYPILMIAKGAKVK
jgi:hypothetical protein